MGAERVAFSADDGVARLTLCSPGTRNAIDPPFVAELAMALDAWEGSGARALLLAAEGPAFTVGGDLKHFAGRVEDLDAALAEMVPPFHRALERLASLPMPIVCAVGGPVAGGGLGLVWPADIVLATDRASFTTGFDRLGLSGDGGSSWWLPRLIGPRRARRMIIGGETIDAVTAAEWGLVDRILPAEQLMEAAEARATEFASGPPLAYAEMRRLLVEGDGRGLSEQLDAEAEAMRRLGAGPDAARGVTAFVAGRRPEFG